MAVRSTVRRLLVVLACAAMAPVGHAVIACAGWSASAAGRMSCCQSGDDHCAATRVDDCCAYGETRQNLEAGHVILLSPDDTADERVTSPVYRVRSLRQVLRPLADRRETYLLDSVFLI
ncbi:MAG TPA: hypothetical protein VGD94_16540 [Vicinamibacterales bacterium]